MQSVCVYKPLMWIISIELDSSVSADCNTQLHETMGQCYKNIVVNYRGNFNPNFSTVKMMQFITTILG
jgi:hypothetical protein